MPTKVCLTIKEGRQAGEEFVFDERAVCIIGRAQDCYPQVPDDAEHKRISRHHCLLDINPPDIRVRDFGSLNGTYVNGEKIGQRASHQTPEEAALQSFPEHDLKEGDEIKLCNTVFRVDVYAPACCVDCAQEIPQELLPTARTAEGTFRCAPCDDKRLKDSSPVPARGAKACAVCGKDASAEIGEHRQGEFVCASCKRNPLPIVSHLLTSARESEQELRSIREYELVRELGRGGMGAVYLARHLATGELMALKVMLPKVAVDARAKELFRREAENTRALQHTNVVTLYDWGFSEGVYFFTLEYCNGGSVADLMKKRGGRLAVDQACKIIFQALDGLDYAHHAPIPNVRLRDGSFSSDKGLVHRDLKPGNIFLSGSGASSVAKIGDYGLAKAFEMAGLSGQTMTGNAAGSPWFMPRQQVLNFKYVRPEVDVWAMAASLYYMLTCHFPRDFTPGQDPWQTVIQSVRVPIRLRDASIPVALAEVIDLALVDQPSLYFKSASDLKRALESTL
jgi:eukaryotic-like serine/threonine-protein kinase